MKHTAHLEILSLENIRILRAVHEDFWPVPIFSSTAVSAAGFLTLPWPCPLTARVSHDASVGGATCSADKTYAVGKKKKKR